MRTPSGEESESEDAVATTVELHVVIGGPPASEVRTVLQELEREAHAAAARATKRLLLGRLHETRVLDDRLLPGGAYEVPLLLTRSIELHERLRSDSSSALAAAYDALQPLAIQGRQGVFVYRSPTAASDRLQREVFLIQLTH